MQTAVIWNYCNGNIKYLLWDGDHSEFDGVYANEADPESAPEILQDALIEFAYSKDGEIHGVVSRAVFVKAILQGATLIECGELP